MSLLTFQLVPSTNVPSAEEPQAHLLESDNEVQSLDFQRSNHSAPRRTEFKESRAQELDESSTIKVCENPNVSTSNAGCSRDNRAVCYNQIASTNSVENQPNHGDNTAIERAKKRFCDLLWSIGEEVTQEEKIAEDEVYNSSN